MMETGVLVVDEMRQWGEKQKHGYSDMFTKLFVKKEVLTILNIYINR